ncbi:hypothetical protein EI94DRAFT_1185017 [Lactarius quietus]|nr:hypothetical protein EI94DRAFT_1185017 [Lactarius quietus]
MPVVLSVLAWLVWMGILDSDSTARRGRRCTCRDQDEIIKNQKSLLSGPIVAGRVCSVCGIMRTLGSFVQTASTLSLGDHSGR